MQSLVEIGGSVWEELKQLLYLEIHIFYRDNKYPGENDLTSKILRMHMGEAS